jgi:anhydro-N-acetylmuramic acid kinase
MKQHIQALHEIAHKPRRLLLGLMSGTSLDGLDLALCAFEGSGVGTRVELLHFCTKPYDDAFRQQIMAVFAKKQIDFQQLVLLNVLIAEKHAALILESLRDWQVAPSTVDAIASHGQTVFHAPRVFHQLPEMPNATLQIGDGDHLARRTGILTLSDFRQKHVAAGGEGAPLALYGDYFLFSKPGEARLLLNIGGIANFTWLPADGRASAAMATDTGPGNTLLDAFARELYQSACDYDARIARSGKVQETLLRALLAEPFFGKPLPKTIGPELFSPAWVRAAQARAGCEQVAGPDLMATLTQLSASSIAAAVRSMPTGAAPVHAYVSGGGAHNPLLMEMLARELEGCGIRQIHKFDALGISGDAKEAILFATLANETLAGNAQTGATLGGIPLISMGKISFPG